MKATSLTLAALLISLLPVYAARQDTMKHHELATTPANKDDCKKAGWKRFNNPSFKDQGDCVSFVETEGKNGRRGQAGQIQRTGPQAFIGTLVDASCKEHNPAATCVPTASTSRFGMILSDGQFAKFDASGDAKLQEALKSSNKQPGNLRVSVNGTISGDTLNIDSVVNIQ